VSESASDAADFQVCTAMRNLIFSLDHIRYRVPCKAEDLVTLCETCHGPLHGWFHGAGRLPKFAMEIKRRKRDG
jgi:hypothetical protein